MSPGNLSEVRCSRILFSYQDLILSSYVKIPIVESYGTGITIRGGNVRLYLKIGKGKETPYYTISIENIYDIVNWLNEGLQWFYLEKYQDMYYRGENNEWVFNMTYKDLHLDTGQDLPTDPIMRIYPNTVRRNNYADPEPGIVLIINRIEYSYAIPLPIARKLLSVITSFSFQEEAIFMTNCIILNLIQKPELEKEIQRKPKNIWEK